MENAVTIVHGKYAVIRSNYTSMIKQAVVQKLVINKCDSCFSELGQKLKTEQYSVVAITIKIEAKQRFVPS